MNVDEARRFLDRHVNLEATAGKIEGLSLDTMTELMGLLGDPHRTYPVVQVTGTNGKGSVAAMVSGLLASQGLHTGTYASPHVSSLSERLRTNGVDIADEAFAQAVESVAGVAGLLERVPSWFELLTATAFVWFADIAVDVAVVEVGLLGRYDATNVADAIVAVVTNVGRDHTDGAPGWELEVAREKAGIIKPGSTLVLGESRLHLRDVFADAGADRMIERGIDLHLDRNELAVGGRLVGVTTPYGSLDELFVPLHGAHQGDNALLAIAAAEAFFDAALEHDIAAEGLGSVRLPGRAEIVARQPLVVLDGAHNPEAVRALAEFCESDFAGVGERILVVGMLNGRDPEAILAALRANEADRVIVCEPDWPRAMGAEIVAAAARRLGVEVEVEVSVAEAVERALHVAHDDDLVVVTGSFYVVGEARSAFDVGT